MNREEFNNNLELYHHGIKGQKWGVRRYQNEDGTLTALAKKQGKNNAANGNRWSISNEQPEYLQTKGYKNIQNGLSKKGIHSKKLDDKINRLTDDAAARWLVSKYYGGTKVKDLYKLDTTLGKEKTRELIKAIEKEDTKRNNRKISIDPFKGVSKGLMMMTAGSYAMNKARGGKR